MNAKEIVRALRAECMDCSERTRCDNGHEPIIYCANRDAADLIESLTAQLAEAQRRERAAVEDILDAAITPCAYCKSNPSNGGNCDMKNEHHDMFSCWEWRGPQEAGEGEQAND